MQPYISAKGRGCQDACSHFPTDAEIAAGEDECGADYQ